MHTYVRQLNPGPHTAIYDCELELCTNYWIRASSRLVDFILQEITAESKDEGDSDEAESPEAKLKE